MRKYKAQLLRIKGIAAMFYCSDEPQDTLVIYGLGAPVVPDSGNLPDAAKIMNFRCDLLVPDYIGSGRSDGVFTPLNCINTFLELYQQIRKGCNADNFYQQTATHLKYKRIIFIGRSLGGTYLPLLPRFNPKIKELGLIYPALDNKSSGSVEGEETNEQFFQAMDLDGYKYLYRGILDPVWVDSFNHLDGLAPMDNLKYLKNAKVFIGHGDSDQCIHHSKSVSYYQALCKMFPDSSNYFLKIYSGTGHSWKTSNQAVRDILEFFEVEVFK